MLTDMTADGTHALFKAMSLQHSRHILCLSKLPTAHVAVIQRGQIKCRVMLRCIFRLIGLLALRLLGDAALGMGRAGRLRAAGDALFLAAVVTEVVFLGLLTHFNVLFVNVLTGRALVVVPDFKRTGMGTVAVIHKALELAGARAVMLRARVVTGMAAGGTHAVFVAMRGAGVLADRAGAAAESMGRLGFGDPAGPAGGSAVALSEKMLRVFHQNPNRLKGVADMIRRLDPGVVGQEFIQMYEQFEAAAKKVRK